MSGMLQGLPQPKLPQEFSKHVLRQAEREMLIPRLRGKEPITRRRWPWKALSWTTAAAVLVIGLLLVGRGGGRHQDQEKIVDVADTGARPSATPQSEVSKQTMTAQSAPAMTAESTSGVATEPADDAKRAKDLFFSTTTADSTAHGITGRRLAVGRAALPGAAVSDLEQIPASPAKSAASQLDFVKSPARPMRVRTRDGQVIEPGTIVDLVPTSGDEALVIRVVVVDMRGGRQAILQVVDSPELNGKTLAAEERSEWQALDRNEGVANAATGPQEGILFEVNTDKISSVIAKLDQEKVIEELRVDAVELSQLDPQPTLVASKEDPKQDGDFKAPALMSAAIRPAIKAKKSPGDHSESNAGDAREPGTRVPNSELKSGLKDDKSLLATKPVEGNSSEPALLSDTSNRLPGLDKAETPFDVSSNRQTRPNFGIGSGGAGKPGLAAPATSGPVMAARARNAGKPVLNDLPKVVKVPRSLRTSKNAIQSQKEMAAKRMRSKGQPAAADPLDPPASDEKGKTLAKVTNGLPDLNKASEAPVSEAPGKVKTPNSSPVYVLFLLEQQQSIPIEPSSKKGR